MNKFKCKKCRKTLLFYPDNISVSSEEYNSICFNIKCPNKECKFINEIKLSKIETEERKRLLIDLNKRTKERNKNNIF